MTIILGREQFYKARVGCCGRVRKDSIYPIGYEAKLEEFKVEAKRVIDSFGVEGYFSDGDTYSVEFFEGREEQNDREDGASIFLLIREEDGKWHFYDHTVEQFTVTNGEELSYIWKI